MKLLKLLGWFALVLASLNAFASADPEHELQRILNGTKRQPVKQLDRTGLKLVLNEQIEGVTLEGWSTRQLTPVQADALFAQFGIRVVSDPATGTSSYIVADNVGRAGILEGDIYLKMNGKIYKGLTLKGYGGNTVHGHDEQPQGSLNADESIRDIEVSTILAHNNVDTYVGVLSVERPSAIGRFESVPTPKSNYVRLSRTALRMEDLIRVRGNDLNKLVNYLTDLMKDEMGKKLTPAEFSNWLVTQTGDLMARKDYIRFMHASITDSNLGIGELVDLGDVRGGGAMRLPGEYSPQNTGSSRGREGFKDICRKAYDNLVASDSSVKLDFDRQFDSAYNERLVQLKSFDASRINLNRASTAQLEMIGFTAQEALEVVRFNINTPDGIVDPSEVSTLKTITRDIKTVLDRTTTDFLRLSDGSQLSAYYVRNVGGAEGVRAVLEQTRDFMLQNKLVLRRDVTGALTGDIGRIETEIQRFALDRAKSLGFDRAVTADVITNFSRFIAKQTIEVILKR
ncbi:hypothetical protein WDW37_07570 [Bdellovibrionota bacterium FG-1]